MSGKTARVLPWVALGVATAVLVGWAFAPASPLYTRVLTPYRLVALVSLLKLAYLLAGAAFAFACRDILDTDNPARRAWFLLSLGLLSTFAAQLCLAPYQVFRNVSPFPSAADIFYVLSYPLFVAAFLVVLGAYREAGFPVGSTAERAGIVAAVGLLAAVVVGPILRPVITAETPLLERILNVTYPILDIVLLLPLALLLRIALRLRGSRAGEVWLLLAAGFAFLCAGDICFAYFQSLGETQLDPFLHATYVLAYGLAAGGAHRQLELLRS